ncbi:GNAT family N-acetyltransferase [Neobacillus vireti]|uniref:GNAT family N-acetyltransferase n=1 Tax=Neobacillus vireti TaxID=220686 RepID=UPI002FFF4782
MRKVEIRRPEFEDTEELNHFFRVVVTNTFDREGLSELKEDIEIEITSKKNYLQIDLEGNGEKRYFLIALAGNKIIGTIEYGPASKLIQDCTNGVLGKMIEVGTVFVHPDYQRQGVGNKLLAKLLQTLKSKGVLEICLDSGYKTAQTIWKKKFGEPEYLLKNYWGQGQDHMIWKIQIGESIK